MGAIRRNTVRVTWTGVESLQSRLQKVPARVAAGVLNGLQALSLLMQNTARREIQTGSKTGRVYTRRSVRHQASAPGEYPATDTGFLVSSVIGEVLRDTFEAVLSSGVIYAKWLEFGTKKMAPRPFLVPTLHAVSGRAASVIARYVREELRDVR